MEKKRFNNVHVCFQQPDGLYPVEKAGSTHLLNQEQIVKLISLGGEWLCVRWIDSYLGMDKDNHKLCEAVQKYLNNENDEEDITSGRVYVTGAWIMNNRRNVDMIFGTQNSIQTSILSEATLKKIVYGGILNEVDKQNIVNATKQLEIGYGSS